MNKQNQKEYLSQNFTRDELECPDCKTTPTKQFIVLIQKLRNKVGLPLHVTSGCRCTAYNNKIGGHRASSHKIVQLGAAYGAIDIKTGRYFNKFRWLLITAAIALGFNNIEVCNLHTHIARVPKGHPQYNRIVWGVSK